MFLSGDRLYAAAEKTLYVFSVSDHKSPIATYELSDWCFSGIITDKHLYLSVYKKLYVFEETTSIMQPLLPPKIIEIEAGAHKILRVGDELILGVVHYYISDFVFQYLQIFNIETSKITSTHLFIEGSTLNDMIAIDESHYLLACRHGLMKTTKDQLIKHYH